MGPGDVEYIAEREKITIEPNFSQDVIHLIGGDVGPFNPQLPIEVPLWMAVNLRQRHKCKIRVPDWMDVEVLEQKKQDEMDSKFFTEMPSIHYMEISQLILNCSTDDVPRADVVRALIKDIWDIRIAKLRSSVDSFVKSDMTHAKLNHLTLLEVNTVRPFLTNAMDHMHMLRTNLGGSSSRSSQSQNMSNF